MGGPVGGTERPEPVVELSGGGAENWGREVLKAEEVTGAGAGARGGAIVETAAEGTNEGVAEVIIGGGSRATAAGKGGEYAGDDMLGVASGLDKAGREKKKKNILEVLSLSLTDSVRELVRFLQASFEIICFLPFKGNFSSA